MISVCVATYGDPEWMNLAIGRALSSTDAAGADDADVISVHLLNGTVSSSRNACAERATGDWLLFLDADDQLAPGFIGAMGRALEQEGTGGGPVLLTPAVQQIRRGPASTPFFYKECSLETGNWLVIGTLIQRNFFWEIGGFEEHPHGLEDWQLWAKAVKAGARIVKVPDAVYIAHMNRTSKHHLLQRDRTAYKEAYERARASVWG